MKKNALKVTSQSARIQYFTAALKHWHHHQNKRVMPWKGIKNPYFIWLSEIILQQTRVEQGLGYYERFVQHYPTIQDLANAPDENVMKLWEGLGYYNRCRNMLSTARYIVLELGGLFPETYDGLIKLKGIGSYTAAAIISFAFDQPYAVVDGNVVRVLSRYFGIAQSFEKQVDKNEYQTWADKVLDKKNPALHNQSIMDLGASVCMPVHPNCKNCPLAPHCTAFLNNKINDYPPKKKKKAIEIRYFHFLVMEHNGILYIQKRIHKDIWNGLYQFILKEQKTKPESFKMAEKVFSAHQILSHQRLECIFYRLDGIDVTLLKEEGLVAVDKGSISTYAFPVVIRKFLERFNYI